MMDQAKDCENKDDVIKYLNWSKANSDLLMNLINDILDYTLITENKL